MMTSSHLKGPVNIVASTTLPSNFFKISSRLPLQSFGWLIFRIMIIGMPIFNRNTYGSIHVRSSEFKKKKMLAN